jgi:hypothetical protein
MAEVFIKTFVRTFVRTFTLVAVKNAHPESASAMIGIKLFSGEPPVSPTTRD